MLKLLNCNSEKFLSRFQIQWGGYSFEVSVQEAVIVQYKNTDDDVAKITQARCELSIVFYKKLARFWDIDFPTERFVNFLTSGKALVLNHIGDRKANHEDGNSKPLVNFDKSIWIQIRKYY